MSEVTRYLCSPTSIRAASAGHVLSSLLEALSQLSTAFRALLLQTIFVPYGRLTDTGHSKGGNSAVERY